MCTPFLPDWWFEPNFFTIFLVLQYTCLEGRKSEYFVLLYSLLSSICMTIDQGYGSLWNSSLTLTFQMRKACIDMSIKITLKKRTRSGALLTCQARTWLKRRRTGAIHCQRVVESMRLERVPASLGFCTCQYYHPLEYLEHSITIPWILGAEYYPPLE